MWNAFAEVLEGYGSIRGTRIPPREKMTHPALIAIWDTIPASLRNVAFAASGLESRQLKIYGSGQANRTAPIIPWVACCTKSVSQSVQTGYFIVFLFSEDGEGFYLSLNQGYQQYYDNFADDKVARRKSASVALDLASKVVVPPGFEVGKIDLKASGSLGQGYEAGAIISKYYSKADFNADIAADFTTLLEVYETLASVEGELTAFDVPVTDADFQASANKKARQAADLTEPPPGPQNIPRRGKASRDGSWRRDPNMAALAINKANFTCEIDAAHETFQSKASGNPFVEAHHLVPMQMQGFYAQSLDVPENIVALCPNCHRRIHHGTDSDRRLLAVRLLQDRRAGLISRGISISDGDLRQIYKAEINEELGT